MKFTKIDELPNEVQALTLYQSESWMNYFNYWVDKFLDDKKAESAAWAEIGYFLNDQGEYVKNVNNSDQVINFHYPEYITLSKSDNSGWIEVLREGKFKTDKYGVIEFSKNYIQSLYDNFKKFETDIKTSILLEHNRGLGSYGQVTDIKLSTDESGMLTLLALPNFSEEGKKLIVEDKKFSYVSPGLVDDFIHPVKGSLGPVLFELSFTNFPALGGVLNEPVYLSQNGKMYFLSKDLYSNKSDKGGDDQTMTPEEMKKIQEENERLKQKNIELSKTIETGKLAERKTKLLSKIDVLSAQGKILPVEAEGLKKIVESDFDESGKIITLSKAADGTEIKTQVDPVESFITMFDKRGDEVTKLFKQLSKTDTGKTLSESPEEREARLDKLASEGVNKIFGKKQEIK